MTLFDNNLLYNERVIDQIPKTRKIIGQAIANQYFGCFIVAGKDGAWLPHALSGYLWSLWLRKTFGTSEYRFMIQQENMKVCKYEDNEGQIILDKHIYSMSARHKKMMRKKGHLVLRILENRLTSILLLQVNTLPNRCPSPCPNPCPSPSPCPPFSATDHYPKTSKSHQNFQAINKLYQQARAKEKSSQLICSSNFQKFIRSVTGKDINDLLDMWVKESGTALIKLGQIFCKTR